MKSRFVNHHAHNDKVMGVYCTLIGCFIEMNQDQSIKKLIMTGYEVDKVQIMGCFVSRKS